MESVLLSRLKQVLYERVDLLGTELCLEVLGHDALREPGRDLGVGSLDRLLDEPRALVRDVHLGQVRPDAPARARVRERVAGATAALTREDRLSLRSRRSPAASATALRCPSGGRCRFQVRPDELLERL